MNLEQADANQKLCQAYLFKSLTQLSTMSCGGVSERHSKPGEHLESFVALLGHLAEYFQSLLKSSKLSPLTPWPDNLVEEWGKVFSLVCMCVCHE